MAKTTKRDIYQEVTDRIIAALERGVAPWVRPWDTTGIDGLPINGSTHRSYNGINVLLLWLTAMEKGYSDPRWMTFRQATALNAQVRKGEKGTLVTFWKIFEREQADGSIDKLPVLKHYTVFNAEQIDGLATADERLEVDPSVGHERAAAAVKATGATIRTGSSASYAPRTDIVTVPAPHDFHTVEDYWATVLHELVHWTSAPSRCNRVIDTDMHSDAYAKEELVAELGSAFLCAELGVHLEHLQHASYLDHWVRVLRADKRAIVRAASLARKATAYILPSAEVEVEAT
jgi:antirestriction protein ArdC